MSPLYEFLFRLCCHLIILLLVAAGDENGHRGGGECPASFDCGLIIGNISFPFTTAERPDCGLFPIQNCRDPLKYRMIQLQNNGRWFRLLILKTKISPTPTTAFITIRDSDFYKLLQSRSCEAFRKNYTLPTFDFGSFSMVFNATLFRCNRTLNVSAPTHMPSYTNCSHYDLYYNHPSISTEGNRSSLAACTKVQLPIKDVPDANDPFTFVTADFLIQVHLSEECANCHHRKRGQCKLDSQRKFYCANGMQQENLESQTHTSALH